MMQLYRFKSSGVTTNKLQDRIAGEKIQNLINTFQMTKISITTRQKYKIIGLKKTG